MSRANLAFVNASCAHCARLVTRSLQRMEGILSVEVDRVGQRVLVAFDSTRVSLDTIRSRMEGSGYPTRLLG